MTLDPAPTRLSIADCRFVLATDLDGTFLGGSQEDRYRLYEWIEANRDSVGLIFVTGRDPEFIADLVEGPVPAPEYVIGDVGTTIAAFENGSRVAPIRDLEAEIAELWGDRGEVVRTALDGHPGLTLQPTEFRFRVSYDLDLDSFDPSARDKIADLGLDYLISDNRFFDVLPKGISKGPSLKRLVDHLGLSPQSVLAAGDTLNDLSMLESGLPAVVVGGAEQALVDRVGELPSVHVAEAVGAAGILEAIRAFDLHDPPKGD